KRGALPLEHEEMELLRGVLHQAAIALEASLLLEERSKQVELERDLEIAAAIQKSLLPKSVRLGHDWDVAAVCRPARHVGGDFFAELPGPNGSGRALVYGDVSGKSVPGALMMMAAKEALHALALAPPDPEELMRLARPGGAAATPPPPGRRRSSSPPTARCASWRCRFTACRSAP